jgi:hypothetical protein
MGLEQKQRVLSRSLKDIACACLTVIVPSACLDAPRVAAAEIKGIVTTIDGDRVSGALVSIVSASAPSAARASTSYCAAECGRHTITSADGAFAIREVTSSLSYTLQVEAKDCFSRMLWTSPLAGQVLQIILAATQSVPDQSRCQFAGQVLRADGQPVEGAMVSSQHPWTTTDREGKFFIVTDVPSPYLAVTVDFEDAVKGQVFRLIPGRIGNTLQMLAGTTVLGRVLKSAMPVEGVEVGLVERASPTANVDVVYEATSNRDGRFTIEHVAASRDFWLFTKMESLAAQNLAAIKRSFRSSPEGQMTPVAELSLHPVHRVSGRLIFSDNPYFISEIRVVLSRVGLPDSQVLHPDEDHTFVFEGVPSESVVLSFHTIGMRSVHGYRLSPKHYNLDPLRPTALCGRVDDDLNLSVLFEKGVSPTPQPRSSITTRAANVAAAKQAIMIQQRNGARVIVQGVQVDPLLERQRLLETERLRGIPADVLSNLRVGQH